MGQILPSDHKANPLSPAGSNNDGERTREDVGGGWIEGGEEEEVGAGFFSEDEEEKLLFVRR